MTVYFDENIVQYCDLYQPGAKPCNAIIEQLIASFDIKKGLFTILSLKSQQSKMKDTFPLALAILDNFLMGEDIAKAVFDEICVRREVTRAFKTGDISFEMERKQWRGSSSVYTVEEDRLLRPS